MRGETPHNIIAEDTKDRPAIDGGDLESERGLKLYRRNKVFLDALRDNRKWEGNVEKMCQDLEVDANGVRRLLNLKSSPLNRYGKIGYKLLCEQLAQALNRPVAELFPLNLYRHLITPEHMEMMAQSKDDKKYEEQTELVERAHNKKLRDAILERYHSIKEFCLRNSIWQPDVLNLINLRYSPFCKVYRGPLKKGDYTKAAKEIAKKLGCSPVDLFPPGLYRSNDERGDADYDVDEENWGEGALQLTETQMMDKLVGTKTESPVDYIDKKEIKEELLRYIGTLSPRTASVMKMRLGLDRCVKHTLEEIAGEVGLTHERVRQIVETHLRRFRMYLERKA